MRNALSWLAVAASAAALVGVMYLTAAVRMTERELACQRLEDPYAPQPQLVPGVLQWACRHRSQP